MVDFQKKTVKKMVLIVDDEQSILTIFSLIFESNADEIGIVIKSSMFEAIEEYKKQKFDAVILDHNLHDSLGLDFIEETDAKNVFYFSGKQIHPESVWPYKENIISVFQKPDAIKIYQAVLGHIGLEYKPYKSKVKFATTSEKESSEKSFKSTRQYRRDFKESFGEGHSEYVNGDNGAKINLAKKLLRELMSVDMVGIKIGHRYRKNFERFFVKKMGITPAQYRKQFMYDE